MPEPEPVPGEVVVELRASALNRRDPWVCGSEGYCPLPVTLGSDGAGIVAALGRGVTSVAVGDEVVIDPTFGWGRSDEAPGPEFDILGAPRDGTFAERVLVPAANLAPRPAHLSWPEAGALVLGALTAWRAVSRCARAGARRTIVVTGAGGGVSTFAIQIGAALGARVLVTSSSDAKIARARTLGAADGVRYDDPSWPEAVVRATGGGADAVVDSSGGATWPQALRALRSGGVLVTYGDTSPGRADIDVSEIYWSWRSIVGTSMGSPRDLRALLRHMETARWRPVLDRSFPLEEIGAAFARLDSPERFGKVALAPA